MLLPTRRRRSVGSGVRNMHREMYVMQVGYETTKITLYCFDTPTLLRTRKNAADIYMLRFKLKPFYVSTCTQT